LFKKILKQFAEVLHPLFDGHWLVETKSDLSEDDVQQRQLAKIVGGFGLIKR
jgi:hypothetical protein